LVVSHFANEKGEKEKGGSDLEKAVKGEQAAYLTGDGGLWDCREVWVWSLARATLIFFSGEWEFRGNSLHGWHGPSGAGMCRNWEMKTGCVSVGTGVCVCVCPHACVVWPGVNVIAAFYLATKLRPGFPLMRILFSKRSQQLWDFLPRSSLS
jgi:hypothetical protein